MKSDTNQPVRLLIVDDHQVVRMGLRLLEQQHDWIRVVGEAATVDEAVHLCELERPDAVILDIRLAGGSGTDACRQIKMRRPEIKVLMLTSYLSEALIIEAIEAGTDGYLLKESDAGQIVESLRTILRGGIAMSPEINRRAIKARTEEGARQKPEWLQKLSAQELRILACLPEGLTNKEIADKLDLSPTTVRNYLERIFQKMGVERRSAAAVHYSRAMT